MVSVTKRAETPRDMSEDARPGRRGAEGWGMFLPTAIRHVRHGRRGRRGSDVGGCGGSIVARVVVGSLELWHGGWGLGGWKCRGRKRWLSRAVLLRTFRRTVRRFDPRWDGGRPPQGSHSLNDAHETTVPVLLTIRQGRRGMSECVQRNLFFYKK